MCINKLCPKSKECYRSTAKPSEYRQSVAVFKYTVGINGVNCEYYIKTIKVCDENL